MGFLFKELLNYSAAHAHNLLYLHKYNPSELPIEYFLIMKEIASRGSLDDASLLHYVMLEINDSFMLLLIYLNSEKNCKSI